MRLMYWDGSSFIDFFDSPSLTGTPTAPTPLDTNKSTSIATTEFVRNNGTRTSVGTLEPTIVDVNDFWYKVI